MLINLRTLFTNFSDFKIVTIAREHRVRCVPEDDTIFGGTSLSLNVGLRGDVAI